MPSLSLDGQTFYYETHGAADRPPIFLLHGYLQIGRDLAVIANALAAAGYHVIAPDVIGYGRSTPPTRSFPPDFYQRDAAAMAELLRALALKQPPHVLGYSDGGEIALLLGVSLSDQLRSVAAWGACGHYSQALGEVVRNTPPTPIAPSHRARHPRQNVDGWYAEWQHAFLEIVAHGGDLSLRRADQLACPLLLMVGAQDAINPPSAVRQLFEAANHPRCTPKRLRVFEGEGHDIHETQVDDFLAELVAFLRAVDAAAISP